MYMYNVMGKNILIKTTAFQMHITVLAGKEDKIVIGQFDISLFKAALLVVNIHCANSLQCDHWYVWIGD